MAKQDRLLTDREVNKERGVTTCGKLWPVMGIEGKEPLEAQDAHSLRAVAAWLNASCTEAEHDSELIRFYCPLCRIELVAALRVGKLPRDDE